MPFSLYLDEDSCDDRLIGSLRRLGFDVLTTLEVGRRAQSDEEQLAFAASQARVIVTANDGDFSKLQAAWAQIGREHAGIVVWKQREQSPEALAASLHRLAADLEGGAFTNGIIHV